MTVQEAIKELKKHKEPLNLWNCLPLDDLQSFDVAIEALEKHIPKKPIHVNTGYVQYYKCPSCGNVTLMSYCSQCGQKLDWEWANTDECI